MNVRGYTLLEVLVATAIFGIAAVGILSALTTSTRNATRITDRDRAVLLAHEQMDQLIIDHRLPKGVPLDGIWDPALTGGIPCGWRANVGSFEVGPKDENAADLERIDLEVSCGSEENRRSFHLSGYRRGAISHAEAAALAQQSASR